MHQRIGDDDPERFEKLAEKFNVHKKNIQNARYQHQAALFLMSIGKSPTIDPEIGFALQVQAKRMGDEAQQIILAGRAIILDELDRNGLGPFIFHGHIYISKPPKNILNDKIQ